MSLFFGYWHRIIKLNYSSWSHDLNVFQALCTKPCWWYKPKKATFNWNRGAVHGPRTLAQIPAVCGLQKLQPWARWWYTKWKCTGATHTQPLNMCPSGATQAYCPSGQLGLKVREREWEEKKANEAWIRTRSHPSPTAIGMMTVYWCLPSCATIWREHAGCSRFKYQQSSAILFYATLSVFCWAEFKNKIEK